MPKKTQHVLMLGAGILILVLGFMLVFRTVGTSNDPSKETSARIAQELSGNGISVERIEESGGAFSSQKSATFSLNGERVTVFFYGSHEEALAIAQQFSSDASTLAGTPMEWVAPPHFYLRNNALVLYIGSSSQISATLTQVFGDQIAGQ